MRSYSMLKSITGIFIASVVMLALYNSSYAGSYNGVRCGTWLVDIGTSRYEVLHKCGQPADIVKSTLEIVVHNRFIPGTGYLYDTFTTTAPDYGLFASEGLSCSDHYRLLDYYYSTGTAGSYAVKGVTITRNIVNTSYSVGDGFYEWRCVKKTIEMERYIYNPGSTGFIRFFTFENGVLVRIDSGERGF